MRSPRHRGAAACCVLVALGLVVTRPASAEEPPSDAERAESLFREGKALLERHEYARACPLLAESHALEPGTGVLLALAICHEADGKLASASADYDEVAARAAREGRADRERVARERGRALRTQASTLTIVPPAGAVLPDGFVVRKDGALLDTAVYGATVPVDGGDHVVEAWAPGKEPWQTRVRLPPGGEHRRVTIPELRESRPTGAPSAVAAVPIPPPAAAALVGRRTPEAAAPAATSPLRVASFSLLAAGGAAAGVGTFFGIRAYQHNEDSKRGCQGNVCNTQGTTDRLAALSAGDDATAAFVAGATCAAVGATLYFLSRRSPARPANVARAWTGRMEIGPGGARFLLEVPFGP